MAAVNSHEGEQVVFQHCLVLFPIHCLVLGQEVEDPPAPSTPEAAPNHDRSRVFNHGDSVLLEGLLDGAGLLTVAPLELTSRKVDSSEDITCSQSLSFQFLYL
jgi:hypothetical protein